VGLSKALEATSLHGAPYYDDACQNDLQRISEHFAKNYRIRPRGSSAEKRGKNIELVDAICEQEFELSVENGATALDRGERTTAASENLSLFSAAGNVREHESKSLRSGGCRH
jgi:hypothetical protein